MTVPHYVQHYLRVVMGVGASLRRWCDLRAGRAQVALFANVPRDYRHLLYIQAAEKLGVDSVVKRLSRTERKRFKECLERMPPAIEPPALVFAQEYKRLCRNRLPLFFSERGGEG